MVKSQKITAPAEAARWRVFSSGGVKPKLRLHKQPLTSQDASGEVNFCQGGFMVRCSALFALLLVLPVALQAQNADEHARRLQSSVIGIDTHNDTVQRVFYDHADLSQRTPDGSIDIPRLREGGMHAPFFALWVPTYYKGAEAVRRTLDLRDAMQRLFDAHPDQIELATTAADLQRIVKAGRIAAVLSVEGGHQIDDDLAVLRMYYRMGIRAMTLTHFRNNDWADSSTDTPAHNGLTDFGRDVVREMNRLGMIVDVSHVSDKTFYDTVQVSTKPVIASHSGCRALSDVPRNMTDDMLRALAKNGGVVGINFGAGFVNAQDAAALKNQISTMTAAEPNLTGKALDDYAAAEYQREVGNGIKTGFA